MLSTHLESVLKAFVVILCFDLKSTDAQDFSYDGTMGPDHWGEQYNGCSGKFQSPINIDLLEVQERAFGDLILEGFDDKPIGGDLVNNGHTVLVQLNYENDEPTARGGPLRGSFRFAQLHFHWGDNDTYGSEDRINNQSFPAELHMVFYNTKYDSFNSAVGHSEGVAVLAFFYNLQQDDNPNYSDLAILLNSLQKPDHHVPYLSAPSLSELGGTEYQKYFTYIGSLTTPPCSEEVLWIDFEEPIMISRAQLDKFRHLYNHEGELITHNFRPVQPLNGRIVERSIKAKVPSDDAPTLATFEGFPNDNELAEENTNEEQTKESDRERKFKNLYIDLEATEPSKGVPFHAKRGNFSPISTHSNILTVTLVFLFLFLFT